MPAWWSKRKTHKLNKEEQQSPKQGLKSFDDTLFFSSHNNSSPRQNNNNSNDFFSSLDSDLKKRGNHGHPLPRPSISSLSPSLHHEQVGSGSVCGSSVSSSGSSSEDHPRPDFGFACRGHAENKISPRTRSPSGPLRSPTSPLHSRACGMNPESPSGDGRNSPCHPLPLPPASTTIIRNCGTVNENLQSHLRMRWKKGRLLGRGTFGHVYAGFNSEGGHMCAIKEVKVISDDQTSKECLRQLNQEITLLGQLSHPNIVQYYGSELPKPKPFTRNDCQGEETLSVYLEYVSGGSIYKLLQEYGPFSEPVIQNYTRQILLGLAYLHGRNTVHRDIKGANILVDPNGEIKLADFGMAKHITSHCSMLSFKGSPYWMAPEVIMNSTGYSLAVDIWSLGCTILEMATSKPPWSQYEGIAAIFKIGNSKDIPEIPETLSNDAKSFLMLCLQRDPFARPTAAQLLDHPFIRDQALTKVPKMNIVNDIFPSPLDGSQNVNSDLRSNETNFTSRDRDNWMRMNPTITSSRAITSPRDYTRINLSLPVSPCSSPLRRYGPAHRSCFLASPPHPSYTSGQTGYDDVNRHSIFPARYYPNRSDEFDIAQLRAGGSPRKIRIGGA
ncbi:hypothetical protein GIB67_031912 [Kingdonia uniflora]|uniref:mitogen-activated protein kinase kinase kinase n=1 Tax=Kingdonia uniflora TaxID=39325 RepID=A0A7J7NU52_9MAGN|nr:hypothetical protein GIB67_031912 [Kingdonia uniflora]